ncbi:MAG: type II toxin-antitoxin system VapC family toxin, partial [Acidobacteriota bacterium]
MSRRILLDTSGWVAAINPRDQRHASAREYYRRAIAERQAFVTTNLLLAETHALVARGVGEAAALTLLDQLPRDPLHEVVWSTPDLEREAIDRWLRPRVGQGISLADAVSFEVMRREGLR